MRVRRVEILRSAGIHPGFTVDGFGDGLTIIEGRNESGKSTLAGAIRTLLWPGRHESLQARGTFETDGKTFAAFVDVHGGGWQGEAPTMPDQSAGRGLIVGIGDLWIDDAHDRAIREAMVRELQGGYDLAPLNESAQPKTPTAPRRDAEKAERELARVRARAQSLMTQESGLPEMRERAEACRRRAARGAMVKDALERLEMRAKLEDVRRELGAMPEGALRVQGDEDRRLRDIRARIDQDAAARETERDNARDSRERLGTLGLPEGGVSAGDRKVLPGLESDLLSIDRQLAEARRRAAELQAGAEAVPASLRPLDADVCDRLEAAINAAHEARERRTRDAVAAEHAPTDSPAMPSFTLSILAVIAGLLAGIAAVIAAAWIAVGLATVGVALGIAVLIRWPAKAPDRSSALTGQAARSEAAYQAAMQAVRDFAGADEPLASTLAIATAVARAKRLDVLMGELHGARAGVESLEAQRSGVLGRASGVLAPYGIPQCGDASELIAARTDLEQRAQEHERLAHRAEEADRLAAQSEQRCERARRELEAELRSLGLTEDRLPELAEWLRLRERAGELNNSLRRGEAVLQRLDDAVAQQPGLRELDRAGLEEERQSSELAGAEADELVARIGDIEGQIRAARAGADVGGALACLEEAAGRVAEARDAECAKAARRLILGRAVANLRGADVPAIIQHAHAWLMRFTANAYGLRIERSEPAVYDLRTGTTKAYAALSTGTRAQALLAMRLAGAMDAEERAGAAPLPLVLDEPLATTDDVRFEAIARALFTLAQAGRQLVYLTCEPGHAARLERLAADAGLACSRINLDEQRGRQATERNPSHALVEPTAGPSPDGMPRAAYLDAIGVQPLDPWASPDAIDVYHLLPDHLHAVHALRERGISTIGQVLGQPDWAGDGQLVRACEMASRLVTAWRRGRARPVTSGDILESGAVSPTYQDQVIELNERVGGSASALLDALEAGQAKGFRANKIDQLRDFLSDRVLLPEVPPAERATVLAEALGGKVMGSSDQNGSELLRIANRLLDLLDNSHGAEREARADLQA